MAALWGEFIVCALAIFVAGYHLSVRGDVIAEKTGLSGGLIGLVLLATATSLPELTTAVGSVVEAGAPDMAVGDVLGSCVFNLAILLVADFAYRRAPSFSVASQGHVLASGFGIVGLGLVAAALAVPQPIATARIGWIGVTSVLLVVVYGMAMHATFLYERSVAADREASAARHDDVSLRRAAIEWGFAAAVVIVAGLRLPVVAERLAVLHGLSDGFVGTLFLATTTSLPELAVTLAALRIGALDMAFANLLGSNLFNLVVLAITDVFATAGPILAGATPVHAATAISAMMMNAVVVIALLRRPYRRIFGTVGWTSLALLAISLMNVWVLASAER